MKNSEAEYAKIADEEKVAKENLDAQEKSNKAAAQRIRDQAHEDAAETMKESKVKVKAVEDDSAAAISHATAAMKKTSLDAQKIGQQFIVAGEAVFVDSGKVEPGTSIAD